MASEVVTIKISSHTHLIIRKNEYIIGQINTRLIIQHISTHYIPTDNI